MVDEYLGDSAPYSDDDGTSERAAKEIAASGELATKRMAVWNAINLHGPLCCFEIEKITRLSHQSVSARIWELVERNMAVRLDKTKLNPNSNRHQEKVQSLPESNWREPSEKTSKAQVIDALATALQDYTDVFPYGHCFTNAWKALRLLD
jgi:hypothetical protein